MNVSDFKIAILGLGYVGLPLAVEFGKKREVTGFDLSEHRINELILNYDSTLEVSAEEIQEARQLFFTSNIKDLKDCSCFIVCVPTPIDEHKRPNLDLLINASEIIGSVLQEGDVVIYESTVYPGATEEICVPVLSKISGLSFNEDYFVGYSPERINPGDQEHRISTVKKVTSGSSPKTADFVDALYSEIVKAGTHKAQSIKVAEAAKCIENIQRDINIALMNELSIIFNKLDIDLQEVLEAAATKWNFLPFTPGLVGGHCIGVDPYYLTHKALSLGYQPEIILAGRSINDGMAFYAAQSIMKKMNSQKLDIPRSRIGVLGVTFKENCPDVRNSKTVDLVRELESQNAHVLVHDPQADANSVKDELGLDLVGIDQLNQLDALIVVVAHREFLSFTIERLKSMYRSKTNYIIGDLKSAFNKGKLIDAGFDVFRL